MPSSQVMSKFKRNKLHSGSKSGPKVKNRKQAVAIMLSEKRAEGKHGGKYPEGGGKKNKLQGALFGGKRPGGRDSAKKREARLEGKPL